MTFVPKFGMDGLLWLRVREGVTAGQVLTRILEKLRMI